jgi:magnesium-transporting ATPase (P-type)
LVNETYEDHDGNEQKKLTAVYEPMGNPTEVAMLKFLQEQEKPIHQQLSETRFQMQLVCLIPFNPNTRMMLTAIKGQIDGEEKIRVVIKGAPEMILTQCNTYLHQSGEPRVLEYNTREIYLEELKN